MMKTKNQRKEETHMYQIGIDIGGTNVKIGLLNEALELCAEISIPGKFVLCSFGIMVCILHHVTQ